ncbi:MAG: L-histidine N(alpha)-methyltransferase [Verrucomicrobia bacterium]|jgi:hypothetical protein|nr:L-histidine N(alpha)-methyltransferase [Verrucomicrobiota bacterium]
MPAHASLTIHESQWPDSLATHLRDSLRRREVNPKFHYESPRQVRRWLRLHEAHSPARREADFRGTYPPAFNVVLEQLGREAVQLIGLGCGGGQKETALLRALVDGNRNVGFLAADVSPGMVISTLQAAWQHLDPTRCSGWVGDLPLAHDLGAFIEARTIPGARRVITFFGLIPNFEPEVTRTVLQRLVRPGDLVLCSANLAPGPDYRRGVEQVMPQYDNDLTRDWLGLLLADLGILDAGEICFRIEEAPVGSGLLRIQADFVFQRAASAHVEGDSFAFEARDVLRLFFSYRHTPATLASLLAPASLEPEASWVSASGEEGVFLLRSSLNRSER